MTHYQISDRLHPGQQQLLAERRRMNIAVMGRRWGKTRFGLNRLVASAGRGRPVGWFAPQYKLLDEAYREARRKLGPLIARQDQQQHRLELHGGGSVDFWTLESPDAGRGRKYALVVIDEAAMARNLEEAWTAAIRPTLADYQGQAWFLSTPKGNNYFKTLFDRAADDPDWARWQLPTHGNPFIHPDEIAAMAADLPRLTYQQEVLAEFVDLSGAAVRREWLKIGEPVGAYPCVMGVDLALSTKQDADYSACAVLARDLEGRVFVRDVQRIQAPFHQVLQFIQTMAAKWKPTIIAIESVQYQAAVVQELLRTTKLPVRGVKPEGDKLTRFQPVLARYEQGLIYHAPGLPRAFEEELLSFPVGDHDDQVDALAYAWRVVGEASGRPVGVKVGGL